jgi:hypothetical protein
MPRRSSRAAFDPPVEEPMSIQFDPTGAVAAAQSQTSVMMLSKSLKIQQQHMSQLLQTMPPPVTAVTPIGPTVSLMGQSLDTFA